MVEIKYRNYEWGMYMYQIDIEYSGRFEIFRQT